MFTKTHVTGVPLTLELAQSFVNLTPLPGERDQKPKRIDFLLRCLRDHTFDGPSWARGRCATDGQTYRLDGQHSSAMLVSLSRLAPDVPFPDGLLVTVTDYEFGSISEDGAALFDIFNHPQSSRTNEDAMGFYRAHTVPLHDIATRTLVKIAGGIREHQKALGKHGMVYPPRSIGLYWKEPRFEQFASWAATFEDTKNRGFLAKPGIVAEMFGDWSEHPALAEEFWAYVFYENHPEAEHETRELAQTYREMQIKRKHRTADYRKRAATAWRHFKRSQSAAA